MTTCRQLAFTAQLICTPVCTKNGSIAQSLSERLGQQFNVENRSGASGNIGSEVVVRAPPDGYTLLVEVVTSNAINATFYANLNFNFIRDIAPVASIGSGSYAMVVNPSIPATTVPEFIAYTRANPGKINYASSGIGGATHVFGELFKMMAGVNLLHVPYRGSFMPDLLGGRVQVVFGPISQLIEHIRTGNLRALAVTTATHQAALPDIPTMAEFVPGYDASVWYGVGAPKKTPTAIIEKLNMEIDAALADATMKARFAALACTPIPMTSAEFGKLIVRRNREVGEGNPRGKHQAGVMAIVDIPWFPLCESKSVARGQYNQGSTESPFGPAILVTHGRVGM
jgi:tripartite-type tricarboxylate transporter receptor subunit TctC